MSREVLMYSMYVCTYVRYNVPMYCTLGAARGAFVWGGGRKEGIYSRRSLCHSVLVPVTVSLCVGASHCVTLCWCQSLCHSVLVPVTVSLCVGASHCALAPLIVSLFGTTHCFAVCWYQSLSLCVSTSYSVTTCM